MRQRVTFSHQLRAKPTGFLCHNIVSHTVQCLSSWLINQVQRKIILSQKWGFFCCWFWSWWGFFNTIVLIYVLCRFSLMKTAFIQWWKHKHIIRIFESIKWTAHFLWQPPEKLLIHAACCSAYQLLPGRRDSPCSKALWVLSPATAATGQCLGSPGGVSGGALSFLFKSHPCWGMCQASGRSRVTWHYLWLAFA